MKTKSALLIFLSLCFGAARSQVLFSRSAHRQVLQQMLKAQQDANADKILSPERTTGQSTRDNIQNTFTDSVQLSYGPNGTSLYDFNMMEYAYNQPYTNAPLFGYAGNFLEPQLTYRTLTQHTINPNTLTYGFYRSEAAHYDASNNLLGDTVRYADSLIHPNLIYANTFNSIPRIAKGTCNKWTAGKSDSCTKRFFRYDAQKRLLRDSVYQFSGGTWHNVFRTVYSYSTGNTPYRIDHYSNYFDSTFTKPLIQVLRYENTFDASGRLLTVKTSYYDGNLLSPYVADTFSYTPGAAFHTSWKQYQFDPINNYWAPVSYLHKQLGVSNLPDVMWLDNFDSLLNKWVPYLRYNISYNANNNPVQLDEYGYNISSFPSTPDLSTRYYYESYSSTTSAEEWAGPASLSAFPNPFYSCTSIEIPWLYLNSYHDLQLILLDETGRRVNCATEISSDKILLRGELSPGVYFFSLTLRGKILGQGRVVAR